MMLVESHGHWESRYHQVNEISLLVGLPLLYHQYVVDACRHIL